MNDDIPRKLMEALREEAEDSRIPCEAVFRLAEEMQVPAELAGRALNELGIKITRCQLGCF